MKPTPQRMYHNQYNLLNTGIKEPHVTDENTLLTTMQFILLSQSHRYHASAYNYITKCENQIGLYNQFPPDNPIAHKHDLYVSPDQLIATLAAIKTIYPFYHRREGEIDAIWWWFKDHYFTYDNLSGKTNFKRIMQPMAVAYAGALHGSSFWKQILNLACFWSCYSNRSETSGKLKAWVILQTMDNMWSKKYCDKFIERYFGSWNNVFAVYYPDPNHPIRRMLYNR